MLERQPDFGFAVGVRVEIDHADFLFEAVAALHQKNGIAEGQLGLENDERAAGVNCLCFRFFVERAAILGETVDHHGNAKRQAFAGARNSLRLFGGDGISKRQR